MLRHVCNLLSLASFSALAITSPAEAQLQPSSGQPQLSGSARLTVRVVAADNGRAVRRASVTLSELPDPQQNTGPNRVHVSRRVETDVNGRFDFTDLPLGSYSINVEEVNGFVRLTRPTYAKLTNERTVEITVRLERAGAIEGRIQDDDGDGIRYARVQVVRRHNVGVNQALATPGASAITNDLGEFRLFSLPAGEYYVVATYIPLQGGNDPAPRSGYPNTYYPNSLTLRGARAVVVRAGRNHKRVNFTIARCPLSRLSISPVDSQGVRLGPEAQISLTKRDDVYLPYSPVHTTRRREDGTFLFDGLQPGDYYLVAKTSLRMEEAAYVNLRVGNEDATVSVQTNAGARVSGRVIVDGRPAGDGGARFPSVTVSSNPPVGKYGISYAQVPMARVQGDRFELTGLRGPMVLSAEIGLGALMSIQRKGEELAGKTLEFVGTETIDDIVVTLTRQVSQLDVSVTTSRKQPEAVLVMLFSEDPARWHQGFIQYARTTASPVSDRVGAPSSDVTRLIRMPPGRYLIAAIPDVNISYPTQVSVFEKLRSLAVPVTLTAGQTARVTIGVSKAARLN